MPIDFPNNPSIGNTYPYGNSIWEWTGSSWQLYGSLLPLPTDFTSRENIFNKTQRFSEGITAQGATFHGHVLFNKPAVRWAPLSQGTTAGTIHLGAASSTGEISGPAITFGARDFNPGISAAAGIYVISDGSFGTRMRFSTTNSYVNGPQTAITIMETRNVGMGTLIPANTLDISGSFGIGPPVTKTTNFTLATTENDIIIGAGTGTVTVTLPAANTCSGRRIHVKTIAARALSSGSANVAPIGSATLGTAILTATVGKWAILVSNGTNWVIMCAN